MQTMQFYNLFFLLKFLFNIPKYNWDYIDFPASIRDYQIFEKNNKEIALNILYITFNQKRIEPEYIAKQFYTEKPSRTS